MTRRSTLGIALLVVAALGVGMSLAQLSFQNDGIQFPDGSFQSTAAAPLGEFVQGAVSFNILDLSECASGDLYMVPNGKRLMIEWMSVEIREPGDTTFDPVDIDVITTLGGAPAIHALGRFAGVQSIGSSFFESARVSAPVKIYSEGNQTVQLFACRNNDSDQSTIEVTFHGRLFDE